MAPAAQMILQFVLTLVAAVSIATAEVVEVQASGGSSVSQPAVPSDLLQLMELCEKYGVAQRFEYPYVDNNRRADDVDWGFIRQRIMEMDHFMTTKIRADTDCHNQHPLCIMWASAPFHECRENPVFMVNDCAPACQSCPSDQWTLEALVEQYGEPQSLEEQMLDDLVVAVKEMHRYMKVAHVDIAAKCKNQHHKCLVWAHKGECTNNAKYMKENCAPACHSCHVFGLTTKD